MIDPLRFLSDNIQIDAQSDNHGRVHNVIDTGRSENAQSLRTSPFVRMETPIHTDLNERDLWCALINRLIQDAHSLRTFLNSSKADQLRQFQIEALACIEEEFFLDRVFHNAGLSEGNVTRLKRYLKKVVKRARRRSRNNNN